MESCFAWSTVAEIRRQSPFCPIGDILREEVTSMALSRRKMLKRAAAAGGVAFVPQAVTAQTPAQVTGTQTGRRFKAFVRHGTGASVEELKLLAIQPREVVIRTQASAVCYTIVGQVLGTNAARQASIPNHSGMGVVEAIGPMGKGVQIGDPGGFPGPP